MVVYDEEYGDINEELAAAIVTYCHEIVIEEWRRSGGGGDGAPL